MKYEELFSIFPKLLLNIMEECQTDRETLQEIRLRVGRPVLAVCRGQEYRSETAVTKEQLKEILAALSNYSLYAYEDEIRQGFLSLPGGHRVGLAGHVVLAGGQIRTITEISSLNIRLAHEIKGCADALLPRLRKKGSLLHTLIVSAPGCGKTTLLRDCIRQISEGDAMHPGLTVGVVDERSEIAGCFRGIPGNDVGMRTDILDGCPKAEGMMMLIRSMAPKVIAVDEIGSREDITALISAMNCGCVLLATVHGRSMEELLERPALKEMIEAGLFERYVFLEHAGLPGQIRQLLGKDGKEIGVEETGC